MNINQVAFDIMEWEKEAQEDFTDYYMHSCIDWKEWAEFLKTKGFIRRYEQIMHQIEINKNTCIDQDLLFRVNGCNGYEFEDAAEEVVEWQDDSEKYMELFRMDVFLWAEFICSHPAEYEAFKEWLDNYGN
ncbi:hypothetical protein ACX818_001392 [Acinetobacter baumannii]